jgi:hypothetical protein
MTATNVVTVFWFSPVKCMKTIIPFRTRHVRESLSSTKLKRQSESKGCVSKLKSQKPQRFLNNTVSDSNLESETVFMRLKHSNSRPTCITLPREGG